MPLHDKQIWFWLVSFLRKGQSWAWNEWFVLKKVGERIWRTKHTFCGYEVIEHFFGRGIWHQVQLFRCFFHSCKLENLSTIKSVVRPQMSLKGSYAKICSGEKVQLQRLQICSPSKLCSPTPGIILIQGAFQHWDWWHIWPSQAPQPIPRTSKVRRGTCLEIGIFATLWQIGFRIKGSSKYHLC